MQPITYRKLSLSCKSAETTFPLCLRKGSHLLRSGKQLSLDLQAPQDVRILGMSIAFHTHSSGIRPELQEEENKMRTSHETGPQCQTENMSSMLQVQ